MRQLKLSNMLKDVPAPTAADKALAQRKFGTVTIKLADQSIPAKAKN